MPTIRERTREEWEDATPPTTKKRSQWEDLVAAVAQGKVMSVDDLSPAQLKGARIGIGRLAKQRGLSFAYRTDALGALLVSQREDDLTLAIDTDSLTSEASSAAAPTRGASTPKANTPKQVSIAGRRCA